MTTLDVLVLEGDGIGPEVTAEALKVLSRVAALELARRAVGGAEHRQHRAR